MLDRLLMKNKSYKEKVEKLIKFKDIIDKQRVEIKNRDLIVLRQKEENQKLKLKLKNREPFKFISYMVIQMKYLEENIIKISKKERNENVWHDNNKIYISRKILDSFLFDEEMNTSKTKILEFLRLMSVIESEGDRFTKKVFINGKYKRMIILNRHIMKKYIDETYK